MPHDRFYTPETLIDGGLIQLSEEESIHLAKVMRHEEGDLVELCNGLGSLAEAKVEKILKRSVQLRVLSTRLFAPRTIEICLRVAHLPHKLIDLVIEKGCELGVNRFSLYSSERGKPALSPSHQERLQKIAISSLKQSGNLYLPLIEEIGPLSGWKSLPPGSLFGSLGDAPSLLEVYKAPLSTTLIIGPQSGLTPKEESRLRSLGAKPVSLNAHVLRAETAAIAGASLLTAIAFLHGKS